MLPVYGPARPREAYAKAKTAALRALAGDSTLADAHAALGYARMFGDYDWPGGERHRDLVARVESAWIDLTSDAAIGRSIVVSHGGPIMTVLRLVSPGSAPAAPTLEPGSIVRLGRSAGAAWQPLPAVAATLGS